jgi:hypothetical protein
MNDRVRASLKGLRDEREEIIKNIEALTRRIESEEHTRESLEKHKKELEDQENLLNKINSEYAKTDPGKIEALRLQVEYWTDLNSGVGEHGDKIGAILERYTELLKKMTEVKEEAEEIFVDLDLDIYGDQAERMAETMNGAYQSLERFEEKQDETAKKTQDLIDAQFDLSKSFENLKMSGRDWSNFLANEMVNAYGESFTAIGEALYVGRSAWEDVKDAAKDAIASILDMLGKQLFIHGMTAMIPLPGLFNPAAGAAALAASATAYIAAGWVRSLEQGGLLTEPVVGVGMQTGATYTLAERGPERVDPVGGGGGGTPIRVMVILDNRPILDVVERAVENRDIIIRAGDLA